jgi:putative endonuclease
MYAKAAAPKPVGRRRAWASPATSLRLSRWGRPLMKYVYILESEDSEHFYAGITEDVPARLAKHNAGEVSHTSKYRPWRLKTYVAFSDEKQAFAFENI